MFVHASFIRCKQVLTSYFFNINLLMKKLLIIAVFIFVSCGVSIGQFSFKNDTSFAPFFQSFIKKVDSSFTLSKENAFELRFWALQAKTQDKYLFILTNKNNSWTARLFTEKGHYAEPLAEKELQPGNPAKLWEQLNKKNLLAIPDNSELKDKKDNVLDVSAYDGATYIFELITKTNKRSYLYHCPKINAEEYKNIKEFGQVVAMIRLIYSYCGISPNYICKL